MYRVGLPMEFRRATSAQVIVFDLLGVRSVNKLAPLGVAQFLALEAWISGQLVLSRNTPPPFIDSCLHLQKKNYSAKYDIK